MRNNGVRASIDCGIKHYFVIGIGQLRPPLKDYLDRLASAGKTSKKLIDFLKVKAMGQPLFGPFQNFLIFEEKCYCHQRHNALSCDYMHERIAGARKAAQA